MQNSKKQFTLVLLGTAATLFVPAFASASDMYATQVSAVPVVVAPPIPFTWTGFYLGGNAGYAISSNKLTSSRISFPLETTSSFSGRGAVWGIQTGYNLQFDSWVVGLEADLDYAGIGGSTNMITGSYFGPKSNYVDLFGTIRGRYGMALNRSLFYVTGGAAFIQGKLEGAMGSMNSHYTNTGYTVGAGIEHAIYNNISIKAEYLFSGFGTSQGRLYAAGSQFNSSNFTIHQPYNIIRLGFNYRF